MKKVALIVQSSLRDMQGLLMVALYLSKNGVKCFLVPSQVQKHELYKLCPDIVLHNSYEKSFEDHFKNMYQCGIRYGIMDNGYAIDQNELYNEYYKQNKKLDDIMFYCLWSNYSKSLLEKINIVEEKKQFITGLPRFDVYSDNWQMLLKSQIETMKKKYNFKTPYILFCTNYTFANQFSCGISANTLTSILAEITGLSGKTIEEYNKRQWDDIRVMIDLAKALAIKYPELYIIVRPHIAENLETYSDALGTIKNIRAIKELEVSPWIDSAIAVIQTNCTTNMESYMRNVPAISPTWFDNYNQQRLIPYGIDFSIKANSKQEFMDLVDKIYLGHFDSEIKYTKNIEYVCGTKDGFAHKRVGDVILNILNNINIPNKKIVKNCRKFAYEINAENPLFEKLYKNFLYYTKLPCSWSLRKMKSIPVKSKFVRWDGTERFFDEKDVNKVFGYVRPLFEKLYNTNLDTIRIVNSANNNDYHFGYLDGRSVTIESTEMRSS